MVMGFVVVDFIVSLMEVEYVVIYVSVVIVDGLAEFAYSLKIGSLQSHQPWSGIECQL